jgi:hypothetical protein
VVMNYIANIASIKYKHCYLHKLNVFLTFVNTLVLSLVLCTHILVIILVIISVLWLVFWLVFWLALWLVLKLAFCAYIFTLILKFWLTDQKMKGLKEENSFKEIILLGGNNRLLFNQLLSLNSNKKLLKK